MRDNLIRTITDGLTWLGFQLDGRSVARLYDLHVVSEDFVKNFLNGLRDLNLENLNKDGVSFPAVDLGDKSRRLCFQVTTDQSAKKVQSTLDKFQKHTLSTSYDEVFILILGKKQRSYSTITPSAVPFDPSRHVIDIPDLITEVSAQGNAKLKHLSQIIQAAGLNVSASQDSDEQAFRKIYSHFDRDALTHRWNQEGRIFKFESALDDLTELLGKGTIKGEKVTKPIHQFTDPQLFKDLSAVKGALGRLKAAYNARVNSGEIRPSDEFAFFNDRKSADQMNAGKLKALEEINKIAQRYSLPPISMCDAQF